MIIIIIRLLYPPLYSLTFLRNFAKEEQSSINGVVWKEKLFRYLANLVIKGHPQEFGVDTTKDIDTSVDHSNITHTNMSIAPQSKERSRYHRQILLEDGPEGYSN